jgi:hypothetical protein
VGRVIRHHQNSVARALLDLFPDIGLQLDRFFRMIFGENAYNFN